jgi:hypothetical protein
MNRKPTATLLLGTKFLLLMTISCTVGKSLYAANNVCLVAKNFDDDKKPARKERSFKNENAVKVFPDVLKKAMHVIAKPGNKKEIEFLVFDVNGNMVLTYKMQAGERKTITELKKGSYMYYVFAEDEYLMTGKIVFK